MRKYMDKTQRKHLRDKKRFSSAYMGQEKLTSGAVVVTTFTLLYVSSLIIYAVSAPNISVSLFVNMIAVTGTVLVAIYRIASCGIYWVYSLKEYTSLSFELAAIIVFSAISWHIFLTLLLNITSAL